MSQYDECARWTSFFCFSFLSCIHACTGYQSSLAATHPADHPCPCLPTLWRRKVRTKKHSAAMRSARSPQGPSGPVTWRRRRGMHGVMHGAACTALVQDHAAGAGDTRRDAGAGACMHEFHPWDPCSAVPMRLTTLAQTTGSGRPGTECWTVSAGRSGWLPAYYQSSSVTQGAPFALAGGP